MKHFVQYAFALCALTMVWQMSAAQETIVTDGVRISDITMQRSAGRLDVAMDVDLTDLKIKSNRSLWITPMVTDGNRYVELPAIVVDGRRRSIVRERQMRREPVSDDIYVRRHNHHMQNVDYETDIPYERWMDNSKLVLQAGVVRVPRPFAGSGAHNGGNDGAGHAARHLAVSPAFAAEACGQAADGIRDAVRQWQDAYGPRYGCRIFPCEQERDRSVVHG